MPTLRGFDPTTYNSTTGTDFTLGARYTYQEKEYIFVRNGNLAADNATADGDVMGWSATTAGGTTVDNYVVSNNAATGGALTGCIAAGVAVGVISKNNYGFILTRGKHTNVKGVATVTVGYGQTLNSGTNASGQNTSDAFEHVFGVALTGLSGGRYTVQVCV